MITLYGRRSSSSVQLVMWAIAELGVEHERLDYGHGQNSTRTDDYLAMNPMGRVPVVTDGPVVMFESAAILRYLGAVYGSETFWPRDPAQRGPLDTWAEWGKNSFGETVLEIFAYDVRLPPETRDPAILERATSKLIPLARMLEDRFGGGPWIAGREFTFADIACGHTLFRFFTLTWDRPQLPGLAAYYERLQDRPAYRAHAMVSYDDLRGSY
jgi:glutathione S-transferase